MLKSGSDRWTIIQFLGIPFTGSTYIRTVLSYLAKSERCLVGNNDNYRGNGKDKIRGPPSWIPVSVLDELLSNNVIRLNKVWMNFAHHYKQIDPINPITLYNKIPKIRKLIRMKKEKLKSVLDYSKLYLITIIRNPINYFLSNYIKDSKIIDKEGIENRINVMFEKTSNENLMKKLKRYFNQLQEFENSPIKKKYMISYYEATHSKESHLKEMTKLLRFLCLDDEEHLQRYANHYETIKTFIKDKRYTARATVRENFDVNKIDVVYITRLHNLITTKMKELKLSTVLQNFIQNETKTLY